LVHDRNNEKILNQHTHFVSKKIYNFLTTQQREIWERENGEKETAKANCLNTFHASFVSVWVRLWIESINRYQHITSVMWNFMNNCSLIEYMPIKSVYVRAKKKLIIEQKKCPSQYAVWVRERIASNKLCALHSQLYCRHIVTVLFILASEKKIR
jgi:hypothetical protein